MTYLTGIWNETFKLWLDMSVYLIFGFAVAGILSRLIRRETVAHHLGGHSFVSVFKAALFGIPLPLCSCGVLPVGLSLHKRGAGRPATAAFLISTPQTGVDSIAVTYGFLGPVFAIARPIAALVNGVLGGMLTAWFEQRDAARPGNGSNASDCPMAGGACGADDEDVHTSLVGHIAGAFRYGFLEFPREISAWLVISIVIAGVLSYFLPSEDAILARTLGTGILPMLVMLVVGIPLYICSTASVPVVAVLVTQGGLSAGAALVFLMAGPATNAAGILLIARNLGKRTAAIYVLSIAATAIVCGLVLDAVYAAMGVTFSIQRHAEHIHGAMVPTWMQLTTSVMLCMIVMIALIRNAIRARRLKGSPAAATSKENAMEIKVEGMTCPNCAEHVRKAAESVAGVESAHVELKKGLVRISGASASRAAIARAIQAAGYTIAGD